MRYEIVYIRVFATILVVLGHCWLYNGFSGFNAEDIPGALTGSRLYAFNKFIYTFHMSLFFGISGYLLSLSVHKRGDISPMNFIKRKAFRFLLPFFCITTFYCIPIKSFTGLFSGLSIGAIIYGQYIQADGAHTWFLLALFWCMMMGLAMAYVDLRSKKRFSILCIALVCLHVVGIPNFLHFVDVFCLGKGIRYSIFFIFGYLLANTSFPPPHTHKIAESSSIRIGMLIISSLLFVASEYYWANNVLQVHGFIQVRLLLLVYDLIGISAILLAFIICKFISDRIKPNKIISYLDKKSYEVYLYSEPLNYLILYVCLEYGSWPFHPSVLYAIRFILTFTGALLISNVVRVNYGQK